MKRPLLANSCAHLPLLMADHEVRNPLKVGETFTIAQNGRQYAGTFTATGRTDAGGYKLRWNLPKA